MRENKGDTYAKDESAKQMGERIRAGDATAEEYFEMGSIMLRKKVYTQAVRNLKLAAQSWEVGGTRSVSLIFTYLYIYVCIPALLLKTPLFI